VTQSEPAQTIGFIDDAHTFGGTQIALARAIAALLEGSSLNIICVCPMETRKAIVKITGEHERLRFVRCPAALPLNIALFPLRIARFHFLLRRLVRQGATQNGVTQWWLNLAGLEFGLAPLLVLRRMGIKPTAWLHNPTRLASYYTRAGLLRRGLSHLRDWAAERWVLPLHTRLLLPSLAAEEKLRARLRAGVVIITGHLYPVLAPLAAPLKAIAEGDGELRLWMIGRIDFAPKNNLAALRVLRELLREGLRARLMVVGEGPDTEGFVTASRVLGVHEQVEMLGWMGDPWQRVSPRDVVLVPSVQEAMPLVAMEAMQRGLKLVVSPIAPFREGCPPEVISAGFADADLVAKVKELALWEGEALAEIYREQLEKFSQKNFLLAFAAQLPPEMKAEEWAEASSTSCVEGWAD
jgi:glycosyltransferase involved in cell wall biosynthesis